MENLTDVLSKKKAEIKKEIKELTEKLEEIEKYEKEVSKVGVGDYIIYDEDDPKIAEICVDECGLYRVFYPQFKEISCEEFRSIEELYDAWSANDAFIDHIPIQKDRVKSLKIGGKYFLFYKNDFDNFDWEVVMLGAEGNKAVLYNEIGAIIAESHSVENLFLEILSKCEYIAKVRV